MSSCKRLILRNNVLLHKRLVLHVMELHHVRASGPVLRSRTPVSRRSIVACLRSHVVVILVLLMMLLMLDMMIVLSLLMEVHIMAAVIHKLLLSLLL